MIKNEKFINYLGEIPINNDDIPDFNHMYADFRTRNKDFYKKEGESKGREPVNSLIEDLYIKRAFLGDGTDRPIGFTFREMHFLYWNVRSFYFRAQVSWTRTPLGFFSQLNDTMDKIISGKIPYRDLKKISDYSSLNGSREYVQAFCTFGTTKASYSYRIRNRKKYQKNSTGSDLDNLELIRPGKFIRDRFGKEIIDENASPGSISEYHPKNKKVLIDGNEEYVPEDVSESCLPAPGPIHYYDGSIIELIDKRGVLKPHTHPSLDYTFAVASPGSDLAKDGDKMAAYIVLDFSSIIYRYGKYWPRIMISLPYGASFLADRVDKPSDDNVDIATKDIKLIQRYFEYPYLKCGNCPEGFIYPSRNFSGPSLTGPPEFVFIMPDVNKKYSEGEKLTTVVKRARMYPSRAYLTTYTNQATLLGFPFFMSVMDPFTNAGGNLLSEESLACCSRFTYDGFFNPECDNCKRQGFGK